MLAEHPALGWFAAICVLVASRDAVARDSPNSAAHSFCFATTCDPTKRTDCRVLPGTNSCATVGAPLHWDSPCVSFDVQKDGSPRRHISYATADALIREAFNQWVRADCGGGTHPAFKMWDLGAVTCNKHEFNENEPNANIWLFQDEKWPYPDPEKNTLAFTSQIYDTSTGVLLDADVEINSANQVITTGTVNTPGCVLGDTKPSGGHPACELQEDLGSIATHEAGHFLGMAHSSNPAATMYANYNSRDLNYRSLHDDDIEGICTLYPPAAGAPTCTQPNPAHGFSTVCGLDPSGNPPRGCAVVAGANAPVEAPLWTSATLAAMTLARRRRRSRA